MDESPQKQDTPVAKDVVIPEGFPYEVFKSTQKALQPQPQRGIVFEDRKHRNAAFISKGLTKPGKISYDTLRRAANSVHVARICINVLKEKITKTKWTIKSRDPLKKVNEKEAEEVRNLLDYPNQNSETFRTLLDKMLEDLLVLDAVSIEKTRYPNGKLAELYFVDSATIRPVYDELGNQDVEIPLKTAKDGDTFLPVSYVQVLDNSQYGGPESGEIVAAWPKKDFIHFHMHPQGAMEAYGYGLSPLEGVLSVVANLLNADNYNSTYFEEGSFPPIILQLVGQVSQRDLEAYREYLIQELTGNFHRPAIMAGTSEAKVIDLKSDSNRDMQFMEYTMFLAKLMCAAMGLSPQDIGLTDDVNRSTSETMEDLSNQKGYSSILDLFKEIINTQIIWRDFGYKDIEFDWVAQDSLDPDKASVIYDTALKNGTLTINEVRQKNGDMPFGEWADEPMMLGSEGYKPLLAPTAEEEGQSEEGEEAEAVMNGEKPYDEMGTDDVEGTAMEKSRSKTMYISRTVENAAEIIAWAKEQGFKTTIPEKEMHVTIAFSKKPVNWDDIPLKDGQLRIETSGRYVSPLGPNGAIVLGFKSEKLQNRWSDILNAGASWDFPEFNPHITITFDASGVDTAMVKPYLGPIVLGAEVRTQVELDWMEGVTEKMHKAIFTQMNHKTWMDDRGYSQPFIYTDIITGKGMVFKPPVAVNLQSQELEQELTAELGARGLNVHPVVKMTFVEVRNFLAAMPDVLVEFDKYVNMTSEYDSEKWRAKFGGSRKFAYYLTTEYIDGYTLSNPLLLADMKRDPNSYRRAISDLANLWKEEKNLVLGDRRADQYIIGNDKRAYGIDYQFKGDVDRWERSKNAIRDALALVPELALYFDERLKAKQSFVSKVIKTFTR